MIIFELVHKYYIFENAPCYSNKHLGYFSDIERLKEAISHYSLLPGFRDAPNGFVVERREMTGEITNGKIFSSCIYAHTDDFENYDEWIELGLFGDKNSAEDAIQVFVADNPLFLSDTNLEIERLVLECRLNKCDGWAEGFSVDEVY